MAKQPFAELALYSGARSALASVMRVDEIKKIRNKAEAMQLYALQAKDTQLSEHATDIRLRAEMRAGELLKTMAANKERQTDGRPAKRSQQTTVFPTLKDLGITKTQSSRWQKLSELDDGEREDKIDRAKRKARAAIDGTVKVERAEKRVEDERRIMSLVPRIGKYRTLVIDPPWESDWLSETARAKVGYATMTHEQLLALDVVGWAEDDCHMYLWTTNNFLPRAVELMAAWGFAHKTVISWIKPRFGLGEYFRNTTEHVLFGVRGKLRTRSDSIPTHFETPVGEHSEKPEAFYDVVRAASYPTAGFYGEAFQRIAREDFANLFVHREALATAAE